MPAFDSPAILVARFLKSNGYTETLAAFLAETNLTEEAIDSSHPGLTIEKVLEEKKLFDLALTLEKTDIQDGDAAFSEPYPAISTDVIPKHITPANVLFVSIEDFGAPFNAPLLIATTADRALRLYSASAPYTLQRSYTAISDSPILSVAVWNGTHLLFTAMSGRVSVASAGTGEVLSSVAHHTKYATRVLLSPPYAITSSYDKSINLYTLPAAPSTPLGEPIGKIATPTPPEALAVVTLPSTGEKAIVFSRRDSTQLNYHRLAPGLPHHATHNLAPESNSWVHYHAMSLAVHPRNPTLLAVATSSVPQMKFLLVRIGTGEVLKEFFTRAPQSAYSTAVVGWRRDGSGVWVNADDGVVRGVEVSGGEVKASLKAVMGGKGEKVRTLWAGEVEGDEVLVTGGFDKGLKVWRVKGDEEENGVEEG